MLDVLLKSKFHSKCKTSMKMTKMRIEMIKRKRSTVEKFLKKDIIDLLKNGLDINAYGRAEGLLIELNMSACYILVSQFCVSLLHQVSKMDKQSDCPGECKEAVASLMYAAARFADLPELRELRAVFVEKYGKSLEANVNHEFIEKLKATPPTKELKIQLLQNISKESGKSWDFKALEQKLYIPPPSDQALLEDTKADNHTMKKMKDVPVKKITQKNTEDSTLKSKDAPSYRTRKNNEREKFQEIENNARHGQNPKIVSEINVNKNMNDWNVESYGQKAELDGKKLLQRKFAPAPYNTRSCGEIKCEPRAKGNNTTHKGELENAPNDANELNVEGGGRKQEIDEKKPFQRKFAPAPYNKRSNSEGNCEPEANGINTTIGGKYEKAPKNKLERESLKEDENQNKLTSGQNGHGGKANDFSYCDRKFNPDSYQENLEKTPGKDYRGISFGQKYHHNEIDSKRIERNKKPDEKELFESKFAPPAPYTLLKAETSLVEEKEVEIAKSNPRSVRSVRSRRSIIPPDNLHITKNDDLDAVRQELATKPGYRSMNDKKEADEKEINEILTHYYKRESPRRGKGLQYRC